MVRVLVAVVLLASGCSSARPAASTRPHSTPVAAVARPVARAGVEPAAIAILRGWDERRAAAYASGDVRELRRLYVAGSPAGARDARVLAAYVARGFVVRGMTRQLLGVRVVTRRVRLLGLRVTDRLVGAVAVSPTGRLRLPRATVVSRSVVLRRVGATWLVASVGR